MIPPPSHHCTAPQQSRRRSPKEKEKTSRIRMDVINPPPLPTAPQHSRRRSKTQVAVAWTSSPPPPPHPPPPLPPQQKKVNKRKRKHKSHGRHHPQMQVEAGMCGKSRDGKNTAKTDAKCDTHTHTGKHRKQRCEMTAEHVFGQCSQPVVAFF